MARGGGSRWMRGSSEHYHPQSSRRCEKDAVQPLSIYCTDSPTDFRFSSQVS
ncbi:hypothetical protein TNCT_116511, partial [Trichonephila clavata]